MMLCVRFGTNDQSPFLQLSYPGQRFGRELMRPLVKFLRHEFKETKRSEKQCNGRSVVLIRGEIIDDGKWQNSKGDAEFVDIVGEFALGDGPGRSVVSLKRRYNTTKDGRPAVSIVVHTPMKNTGTKICQ